MQLNTYVSELLRLNESRLANVTPSLIANYGFGLIEEALEFVLADDKTEATEFGDCLAYATLLLYVCCDKDTVDTLVELEYALEQKPPLPPIKYMLAVAGNLKRHFREGQPINKDYISRLAVSLWNFLKHTHTLADICQLNVSKLSIRLANGTMFIGSGDR